MVKTIGVGVLAAVAAGVGFYAAFATTVWVGGLDAADVVPPASLAAAGLGAGVVAALAWPRGVPGTVGLVVGPAGVGAVLGVVIDVMRSGLVWGAVGGAVIVVGTVAAARMTAR
ncbi:hypothetical protein [Actinokineospora fastidiosa]|nr:hypothetical protein [Actinokineospora fastidiosa]